MIKTSTSNTIGWPHPRKFFTLAIVVGVGIETLCGSCLLRIDKLLYLAAAAPIKIGQQNAKDNRPGFGGGTAEGVSKLLLQQFKGVKNGDALNSNGEFGADGKSIDALNQQNGFADTMANNNIDKNNTNNKNNKTNTNNKKDKNYKNAGGVAEKFVGVGEEVGVKLVASEEEAIGESGDLQASYVKENEGSVDLGRDVETNEVTGMGGLGLDAKGKLEVSGAQGGHVAVDEDDAFKGDTVSQYGQAIKDLFEEFQVEKGSTWDIWNDNTVLSDWIVQHPPAKYLGQSSSMLPVAEHCESGDDCDTEFHLKNCASDDDCKMKQFCQVKQDQGPMWDCPDDSPKSSYFQPGMCKELDSTQKTMFTAKHKLCVGHSYEVYERMFNHIIQAQTFVDITSLDSFDMIGTSSSSGLTFAAVFRNAISYLASTGREITVRIHFGTITGGAENVEHIADEIWPEHETANKMNLHITTYHVSSSMIYDRVSWNHGKIIAVDGNQLFTGGTNYYSQHYLWEDPVFDVDLQVQGSAAVTAHKWANHLHKMACEQVPNLTGSISVGYARRPHSADWGSACPPEYVSTMGHQVTMIQNSPITIIPTARLGMAASDISSGQKTSDLAMYAIITKATKSVKISQQDMLPVYMYGPVTVVAGNAGYATSTATGMAAFDDTWRQTEAMAKAMAKGVKVSMMLSAPCAIGADPAGFASQESVFGSTEKCPEDGTAGKGHDYWSRVYSYNDNKWPQKRDVDNKRLFFPNTSRASTGKDLLRGHRSLGGYGYGWSLDNVADWIFAYYAIFPENRPKDEYNNQMSDGEIVNHICRFAEIGHTRMTKEEETYMRISKEHPERKFRGGQVGNHAKVLIADDSIFYVGSDNMYGAGLAEFGLTVDDKTKSEEFVAQYFEPRWNELLGTMEKPGLVTGNSRVATGCPWKEKLPVRPKPWSDILLVIAYGDKVYLNIATSGHGWLTNDSSVKVLDARLSLGDLDNFQWTFRSQLGDGSSQSPDPLAGTCIKYDSRVFLQANNEDGRWLSGGLGQGNTDVQTGDHMSDGNSDNSSYEWIVRSNPGNGLSTSDPRAGECVSEKDQIYIQANHLDNRWLTGSSSSAVNTKDYGTSDGSQQEYFKWIVEMSPDNLGEKCVNDEDCDSGRCSTHWICEPKLTDGETCFMNDDCVSGRCESDFSWIIRTCKSKSGELSACNENSDCLDPHDCTWGFVCGQECMWSDSCPNSKYCSNRFTCEPKLEDDTNCFYDDDCASGNCKGVFPLRKCGRGCFLDSQCHDTESCSMTGTCLPKSKEGEGCLENDDCMEGGCSWMGTCGKTCAHDSFCTETGRCSKWLICEAKLPNGEWCGADNDCQSNRCDNLLTCRPKSEEGEGCVENDDCKAGQCSWMLTCGETTCAYDSSCPTGRCSKWLICEPLLKNGEGCFEDDDCVSGRCDKWLTCRDKLGRNQGCWEHDDCQSNNCSWDWWSANFICK